MATKTVAQTIDMIRTLVGDEKHPFKYPDQFILNLLNQEYNTETVKGKFLTFKDTISGDATGRYSLDSNLTYAPVEISRVFIGTTEVPKMRRLETDVLEGSPAAASVVSEGSNVYVWRKVALSDTLTEQTLTTGSGELTAAKMDSSQGALPTFVAEISVDISSGYQDRTVYVSTAPTISSGNVTFGLTMSEVGDAGTPYFDIIVRQM